MTTHAASEPDHVYERVVAATGIDPAKVAADLERAIVQPLRARRQRTRGGRR